MKSREQKQAEAIVRKRSALPALTNALRKAGALARETPDDGALKDKAAVLQAQLAKLHMELGETKVMAEGLARAVAAGCSDGSWLS